MFQNFVLSELFRTCPFNHLTSGINPLSLPLLTVDSILFKNKKQLWSYITFIIIIKKISILNNLTYEIVTKLCVTEIHIILVWRV